MAQVVVQMSVIVKAETRERGQAMVEERLRKWFEEGPYAPPYPNGTLLSYSVTGAVSLLSQDKTDRHKTRRDIREGPLGCPGSIREVIHSMVKGIVVAAIIWQWAWAVWCWKKHREPGWFAVAFGCHALGAFLLGQL